MGFGMGRDLCENARAFGAAARLEGNRHRSALRRCRLTCFDHECLEMHGLVTHYSLNGLDAACGRSSATLLGTADAASVSCKSCQRSLARPAAAGASVRKSPSLADLRKSVGREAPSVAPTVVRSHAVSGRATSIATTSSPVVQAPVADSARPASATGLSVKAAWAQKLAAQSDRCRLPRGKAGQRQV